jgi:hypothetical protein
MTIRKWAHGKQENMECSIPGSSEWGTMNAQARTATAVVAVNGAF